MMYDGGDAGWGAGSWVLMGLAMLLFWGLVIGGLVWLLTAGRRGGPEAPAPPHRPPEQPRGHGPSPYEVLDERFARGEIDEAEYRHRRDVLARS